MKKIVIVGGGNGSAVVINALKPYREDLALSAIISTCDSGGSSGKIREEFDVLPPGDLLRAVLAMSMHEYAVLKDIFYQKRFADRGKLNSHNVGNLFLALAANFDGNMINALRALEDAVSAVGHVYPMTLESSDLCVSLTDGSTITGEHMVDRPTYDRSKKIVRTWLQPTPMIFAGAKQAVEEADVVLLGPGTLYGSIIPNLLVDGMKEALEKTNAKVYFILGNSFEAVGETGPETIAGAVSALRTFLPKPLDGVIYNNSSVVAMYKGGERRLLTDDSASLAVKVMKEDLGDVEGLMDTKKLGIFLKTIL